MFSRFRKCPLCHIVKCDLFMTNQNTLHQWRMNAYFHLSMKMCLQCFSFCYMLGAYHVNLIEHICENVITQHCYGNRISLEEPLQMYNLNKWFMRIPTSLSHHIIWSRGFAGSWPKWTEPIITSLQHVIQYSDYQKYLYECLCIVQENI